jgi:hypothetical protein
MYYIILYDLVKKDKTIYAKTSNPAKAYEMAHEYHAAALFSRDEDGEKDNKAYLVFIEDEDGNSRWKECCEARRPAVGLFA